MMKLETVIPPFKLDDVKVTLERLGLERFTISHVLDHDALAAKRLFYRGSSYKVEIPKVKLEVLVSSEQIDGVIEALSHTLRTGADDDGEILIYEVADAVRVRTGQRLQFALA